MFFKQLISQVAKLSTYSVNIEKFYIIKLVFIERKNGNKLND